MNRKKPPAGELPENLGTLTDFPVGLAFCEQGDLERTAEDLRLSVPETARLALLLGVRLLRTLPICGVASVKGTYQDCYVTRRVLMLDCGHSVTDPADVHAAPSKKMPCEWCSRGEA